VFGERAFLGASWERTNHIAEWLILGDATETARPPCAQILRDGAFNRTTKQQPRFPHRARHHTDVRELFMCVLWPVAAAHRSYKTHHLTPTL